MPIVVGLWGKPLVAGGTPKAFVNAGKIAWVPNGSMTVRNAMRPISSVRASAPERSSCMCIGCIGTAWVGLRSIAAVLSFSRGRWRPRRGGHQTRALCGGSHHVVVRVLLVVEQVRRQQRDRVLAGVLPPVLHAPFLDRDLAHLVFDRDRAVAGVLVDCARDDVNDG